MSNLIDVTDAHGLLPMEQAYRATRELATSQLLIPIKRLFVSYSIMFACTRLR